MGDAEPVSLSLNQAYADNPAYIRGRSLFGPSAGLVSKPYAGRSGSVLFGSGMAAMRIPLKMNTHSGAR